MAAGVMLVQWVSESRLGGAAARQSQYSREFLTCDKSVYAGSGAMVPGYPDLYPFQEDYWDLFWKIYYRHREPTPLEPPK